MRTCAILVCIALLQASVESDPVPPVPNPPPGVVGQMIGGTAVTPRGTYPWNAFIVVDGVQNFQGSLIHGKWVLTTAFVVHGHTNFKITLGVQNWETAFEDGRMFLETTDKVVNPSYVKYTDDFNIAVLKLPMEVITTSYIKPIMLPKMSEGSASFESVTGTATGWGTISAVEIASSPELHKITVPVMANSACRWCASIISGYKMCVDTTAGVSPCHGDYGSPLAYQEGGTNWVLIGLFAWPDNRCEPMPSGKPAIYLRVSKHLAWINTATANDVVIRP